MDPNATLAAMLDRARIILAAVDEGDTSIPDVAYELAEFVTDLDAWLARGGFLPSRWGPMSGR